MYSRMEQILAVLHRLLGGKALKIPRVPEFAVYV